MTTPLGRFDHVALAVSDLETMTDWYARALDLTVEFDFSLDRSEFRGVMLLSPAGYRIELRQRPATEAARTYGAGRLALVVPDVDTAYGRLIDAGATDRLTPRRAAEPGVRTAYVADPEGNLIEMLDRSTAGGRVAA